MSKNLKFKGVAVSAALALAASALVATVPANAAVTSDIVTGLASGTSFNSVVGYDNELRLSTTLAPGLAANETTLHYRVENPSGAKLEIGVGNTTSAVVLTTTDASSNTGEIWAADAASRSTVDADTDRSGMQTQLTSFNVIPLGTKDGEADDNNFITIGVADANLNVTVTVYAWLDSSANAENVQISNELQGNSVTLNFFDQANVAATTALVTPVTGADNVQATFTTTPELNGQQLGADFFDMSFTAQGNSNAVLAKNTSSDADQSPVLGTTTYNGTTKVWTSTAYLKYSKATDAWNGTDGTKDGIADLLAVNVGSDEATVAFNATTNVATLGTLPHGLVASGGSWAITLTDIDSIKVAANTDEDARAFTVVDANSGSYVVTTPSNYDTDTTFAAEDVTGGAATFWSVGTSATVTAGYIFSARPFIGTSAVGTAASTNNTLITASDTEASVAVSANVAEGYNDDAGSADTVEIRTGTTSVSAVATVYYTDANDMNKVKAVGAGIPVTGSIVANSGTFQINTAGAGVTSAVAYTNANGEVNFTVTTTTASSASNSVDLTITPQSASAGNSAKFVFVWDDAAFKLHDLNHVVDQPGSDVSSFRSITTGGSYTYSFALLDQWGQAAPSATWQLQVVNSGRTVSSDTYSLSNGRVSVAVADKAQGAGTTITSTVNVQKLVTGTWTTQASESWDGTGLGTVVINTLAAQTDDILLDADAGTSYQSSYDSNSADLTDDFSSVKVAVQDRRTSAAISGPSVYTGGLELQGRVINKLTGLGRPGQFVTVSGDSSILFSAGSVDSFGSITVPTDAQGDFAVVAYSNKAQALSTITYTTSAGASKTNKVTFNAAGTDTGKVVTITNAKSVKTGRTFTMTGLLVDKWGNPVAATANDIAVSYSGPGYAFSAAVTTTAADGSFRVSVLLGSAEYGVGTLTAVYDPDGSLTTADTDGDRISATSSIWVGPIANAKAGAKKGNVVVEAYRAKGKTVSVFVGSTRVASFVADKANDSMVVRGVKSGTRNVRVVLSGPGEDFRGAITVK